LYSIKTESPPIAFDISNDSSAYALGTNDGSIIIRALVVEESKTEAEAEDDDDMNGIIINTESKSTKVSKNYKYFYRGAYVKAKEDEIKVLIKIKRVECIY
jgi:hypothetical protein